MSFQEKLDPYCVKTAKPFFILAVFFLIVFALIIHWDLFFHKTEDVQAPIPDSFIYLLYVLWIPFIIDGFIYLYHQRQNVKIFRLLGIFLFPPSRIMHPAWLGNRYIWLPRQGWQVKTKHLAADMDRRLDPPMMIIAFLILPILLFEFIFKQRIEESLILQNLLYFSTMFIWFAFTLEFIVKFSLASRKIPFCKTNIINIAIILLPLLSFLRGLRVLRVITPFLNHGKLLNLTKTMRLRGVSMKIVKGFLAIGFIQTTLKKYRRPASLKALYRQQQYCIDDIETLEEQLAEQQIKLTKIKNKIKIAENNG